MRACLAGGVSVSASVCGVRAVRARAPSNVCALVRARGGGGWVGVVGGRRGAWRRGGGGGGGGGWQGVKVGVGSWWGGGAAETGVRLILKRGRKEEWRVGVGAWVRWGRSAASVMKHDSVYPVGHCVSSRAQGRVMVQLHCSLTPLRSPTVS